MKHIFLFLIFSALSISIKAQQLPYNNQLIFNKFSYIPAAAGLSSTAEGFAGIKQQWLGIKGAPLQENFYFHTPIAHNMGLGSAFIMEQTGNFSNFYFCATYSYHIQFSPYSYLSVALTPNLMRNQLDFSRIHSFGYNIDPALQNNQSLSLNIFDVGISMLFYSKGLHIGINVPRTIAMQATYKGTNLHYSTQREYFSMISYRFPISEKIQLEPLVSLHTNELWKPDIATAITMRYTNFWISSGYKTDKSLMFSIGVLSKTNIMLSYSYEVGLSALSAAANGTHEISIGFLLGKKDNVKLLATVFNPISEKEANLNKIQQKIAGLETKLNNEMEQRTSVDNKLQNQIDSLKTIIGATPIAKPQNNEPKWVDSITTYAINFGYLNDKILSSSFPELDKYASILTKDKSIKMKIIVYTDTPFANEFNKELSKNRAKNIAEYFLTKPGMKGRIFYEGKGSTNPIATGNTPEARAKNSRVIFLFNKKINL